MFFFWISLSIHWTQTYKYTDILKTKSAHSIMYENKPKIPYATGISFKYKRLKISLFWKNNESRTVHISLRTRIVFKAKSSKIESWIIRKNSVWIRKTNNRTEIFSERIPANATDRESISRITSKQTHQWKWLNQFQTSFVHLPWKDTSISSIISEWEHASEDGQFPVRIVGNSSMDWIWGALLWMLHLIKLDISLFAFSGAWLSREQYEIHN